MGKHHNSRLERIAALIAILLVLLHHTRNTTHEYVNHAQSLRRQVVELQVAASEAEHRAALASNTVADPAKWAAVHTAKATAYSCNGLESEADISMNCPNGITASGTIPRAGVTIACPPDMLGQILDIQGIGRRVCEDTGGSITTGRIDIYMNHVTAARTYGVQILTYKVLR